jgi:hypothetical protein
MLVQSPKKWSATHLDRRAYVVARTLFVGIEAGKVPEFMADGPLADLHREPSTDRDHGRIGYA